MCITIKVVTPQKYDFITNIDIPIPCVVDVVGINEASPDGTREYKKIVELFSYNIDSRC